jgi:hypothetical protein
MHIGIDCSIVAAFIIDGLFNTLPNPLIKDAGANSI